MSYAKKSRLGDVPAPCGPRCCSTLRQYIAEHLDPHAELRRADATDADAILADLNRVFVDPETPDTTLPITADDLRAYCEELGVKTYPVHRHGKLILVTVPED